MRGSVPLLALPVIAALGLAACGDSESPAEQREASDREQIEAVARGFAEAVTARDAEAFCATLAPADVERLGEGRNDGRKRCLVVWGRGRNPLFEAGDTDLTLEEITKLDASTATAKLANGGELAFTDERGAWHVHLAPAGK
jgi:hypothetical protein